MNTLAEFPTATEIAADVRAGRRSAADVVEASLARIAEVNETINAFTVVMADEARAAAKAIDEQEPSARGPLAGVPVAIKAEIPVRGHVTSIGGRGNSTPSDVDGASVRKLREAGAVIVGITNMPEFGQFPFTEPSAFGITRNPWSLNHTPGGSSGGSAAAVASGCVPVAMGGDGGGSIRIPSSACGLVGLKPARGRVSPAPNKDVWGTLGALGPLTRTAADSALVYDVIQGNTPSDRFTADAPERPYVEAVADTRPRRIAVLTIPATRNVKVDPQVEAAVKSVADALRAAGHDVVEAEGRWPDASSAHVPQFFAAIRDEVDTVEHPERLELRTRHTAAMGALARGPVIDRAINQAKKIRGEFQERFAGFDAVLSPTLAVLIPTVGQLDGVGSFRALTRAMPMTAFTSFANATGLPAMSIPAGVSKEGLPIGAQLSGLVDDEGVLLGLAASLGL